MGTNACLCHAEVILKLRIVTFRPSLNFTARSSLPVGAGLGSSAAYSACIATALLLHHHRIDIPPFPERSRMPNASDPGHTHVSHEGRRAIPPNVAEEINRWAFVSEKVLHGNPSGVDNSIVVFGGALAYTKPGFGKKSGMDKIKGCVRCRTTRTAATSSTLACTARPVLTSPALLHSFKSLRFLLTDSKVSRDTKRLVAGVAQKKSEVRISLPKKNLSFPMSQMFTHAYSAGTRAREGDLQVHPEHLRRSTPRARRSGTFEGSAAVCTVGAYDAPARADPGNADRSASLPPYFIHFACLPWHFACSRHS